MSLSHSREATHISELSPPVSEITVVNLFPRNSGELLDQRGRGSEYIVWPRAGYLSKGGGGQGAIWRTEQVNYESVRFHLFVQICHKLLKWAMNFTATLHSSDLGKIGEYFKVKHFIEIVEWAIVD